MKIRKFQYTGNPVLTRGDYGVAVTGGHTVPDDPGGMYVFDPDFGDDCWGSVDACLASGDWKEIRT